MIDVILTAVAAVGGVWAMACAVRLKPVRYCGGGRYHGHKVCRD